MSDDIRKIQLKDEETKFLYDEIQNRKQDSIQDSPSMRDEEQIQEQKFGADSM